jgi:UDPglucose 6-dehydrogenase
MEPKHHIAFIDRLRIGIVGNGYVGGATALLENAKTRIYVYDTNESKCVPEGLDFEDLSLCNVVFICVPTPSKPDGECHTNIVSDVIERLKSFDECPYIVVKSTVPVGFCEEHGVNFMPEFLTEKNWRNDFCGNEDWIFGSNDPEDKHLPQIIKHLFKNAHKEKKIKRPPSIYFTDTKTAELCKHARNCFLATKVSFFNEIYSFCEKNDITFEAVRELVCLDSRIGESHTKVPGHDGKRGFGGTCFPKDMGSLVNQFKKNGTPSHILDAAINRNVSIDRPEKDWLEDRGRAVV